MSNSDAPIFRRTTFTFSVLSEAPIPQDADLAEIMRECDEGDYVMEWPVPDVVSVTLTGKEMADALRAASSHPSFFGLDDNGNRDEHA